MPGFASLCLVAALAADPVAAPRTVAEAFLAAGYGATAERNALVARSESKASAAGDWAEDVYEPTWDAAFVVRAAPRVVREVVKDATASAEVAFTPIARVEVGGRVVPIAAPAEERATLVLVLQGGHWRVVDPGTPIVGVDAVIAAYHAEAKQFPKAGEPSTPAQAATRERIVENLARLEALRDGPAAR